SQGKYAAAEGFVRRRLAIDEQVYGPQHPEIATDHNNLADLLSSQVRAAEPLHGRWQAIREKVPGPEHSDVAQSLNNEAADRCSLAAFAELQGKFEESERHYRLSLTMDETFYGRDHHEVAKDLNNLAIVLSAQGKYAEAIPLLERAFEIRKKVLGGDHPDTIGGQDDL
ncbi:unnamed protein product, partial [Hapterophycus canaliculatus]